MYFWRRWVGIPETSGSCWVGGKGGLNRAYPARTKAEAGETGESQRAQRVAAGQQAARQRHSLVAMGRRRTSRPFRCSETNRRLGESAVAAPLWSCECAPLRCPCVQLPVAPFRAKRRAC